MGSDQNWRNIYMLYRCLVTWRLKRAPTCGAQIAAMAFIPEIKLFQGHVFSHHTEPPMDLQPGKTMEASEKPLDNMWTRERLSELLTYGTFLKVHTECYQNLGQARSDLTPRRRFNRSKMVEHKWNIMSLQPAAKPMFRQQESAVSQWRRNRQQRHNIGKPQHRQNRPVKTGTCQFRVRRQFGGMSTEMICRSKIQSSTSKLRIRHIFSKSFKNMRLTVAPVCSGSRRGGVLNPLATCATALPLLLLLMLRLLILPC